MKSWCRYCKQMKDDVIWRFYGDAGCKACADIYFHELLHSKDKIMKDRAITEYLERKGINVMR